MVASPCVNVCQIDPGTGWCRGCARSLDEIAGWGGRAPAAQRLILSRLPERRAELQREGRWLGAASPRQEDRS